MAVEEIELQTSDIEAAGHMPEISQTQTDQDTHTLRKAGGFLVSKSFDLITSGLDGIGHARNVGERVLRGSYRQEVRQAHQTPTEIVASDETLNRIRLYNPHHLGNGKPNLAIPSEPLAVSGKAGIAVGEINTLAQTCNELGMAIIMRTSHGNRSVSQSARNFLECIDILNARGTETDKLILTGSSLGAMVSLEAIAQAHEQNRDGIDSAVIKAPAGLKSMMPDRDPLLMLDTIRQFNSTEVRALARILLSREFNRHYYQWRDIAGTTPRSIGAWSDILHMTRDVMRGPLAGIGERIPKHASIAIQMYEDDAVTTPHLWPVEFRDHPNVNIDIVPGSHMDLLVDGLEFTQTKLATAA